jgi:hypothetical protein
VFWRIMCIGNPEQKSPKFVNVPAGLQIDKISPLSSVERSRILASFVMFLKTTRQRHLKRLCDEWKSKQKRKRVSPSVKQARINNMEPTSLFHCLYRLRLRSNYADADSFLLNVDDARVAQRFHSSIRTVCWSIMLVLELLVARYIKKKEFDSIVSEFSKYDKSERSSMLVQARWAAIKSAWC